MKKFDYLEMQVKQDMRSELEAAKQEDSQLSYSSKEVPTSSQKKQQDGMVVVTYNWKNLYETSLKISEISFENGNDLENLYKLPVKDGIDRTAFNHNGKTYILRKVVRTVVKTVYDNAKKAAAFVEKVIGHLKTAFGNYYMITKLEKETWTFDSELKADGLKLLEPELLKEAQRSKLFEEITDKIGCLHGKNLVLGTFSLNNVMLYDNEVMLSDARLLKETRKPSYLVREFEKVLSVLQTAGFASSEETAYAVSYYLAANQKACREWYKEETKKDAKCDDEIAELLEK
ncbi:MAG: hypothetical protein V1492_05250 [Candidatus Micrarchaeota archaeon]